MRDSATVGVELLNNVRDSKDKMLDEMGNDYLRTLMKACDAARRDPNLLRRFPDTALLIVAMLATSSLAEKLAQPIIERLRENN